MPRTPRSAQDVEAVKMQIIEGAKLIICKDGFNQLSMRKLASELGMTAANIYNYYANKDEIYLGVQTAGFAMLQMRFHNVVQQYDSPEKMLEEFVREYLDFGMNNPDYYEVMLGSNTPKYADYVGTDLEKAALAEKQTALAVANMTTKVIMDVSGFSKKEATYKSIQTWTALHGVVSLHNNRVLQEMDLDLDGTIERICTDLLSPLKR